MVKVDENVETLHVLAEKVYAAKDFRALRRVMLEYYRSKSIDMSIYVHDPPIGSTDYITGIRIDEQGYPNSWRRAYIKNQLHHCDPMMRYAGETTHPFRWLGIHEHTTLSPEEEAFLDLWKSLVGSEGYSFPVFGPYGRSGYFGLAFSPSHPSPILSVGELAEIQFACEMSHLRFCDLVYKKLPVYVSLSDRERQILRLIARGKRTSGISKKLEISANTVDTYVQRMFGKLEVETRIGAALRGIAMGLID